jgi:glycosyltransferase involved in cell wall biosynthesis
MNRPKIAFISEQDARDKRSWSGTQYFIWQALQNHVGDVTLLEPYTPRVLKFFCSAFNYLSLRILKKRFDYRHSDVMSNAYGKHYSKLLRQNEYDLVVISASIATMSGIQTKIPTVYINDRVISGAINYHKILTDLFAFSRRQSIANDRKAILNSSLSVFCSDWAADAARAIAPDKVVMIPFGANLEKTPEQPNVLTFPPQKIKLLFAGVNWFDKGGPKAFDALLHLLNNGYDAELSVVGCTPPKEFEHEKLTCCGFLNKNNVAEFEQLTALYRSHHFFILPTKYEAYGLVFCESAAYGLPALAPRTGGIPTIIDHEKTGILLPETATGQEYANEIIALLKQPELWQLLRTNAYQKYTSTLNWESWAATLKATCAARKIID